MSRRAVFTQTDISRALKGCRAAGVEVCKVEIGRDGKIVLYPGAGLTPADDELANEWDEVFTDAPKA